MIFTENVLEDGKYGLKKLLVHTIFSEKKKITETILKYVPFVQSAVITEDNGDSMFLNVSFGDFERSVYLIGYHLTENLTPNDIVIDRIEYYQTKNK